MTFTLEECMPVFGFYYTHIGTCNAAKLNDSIALLDFGFDSMIDIAYIDNEWWRETNKPDCMAKLGERNRVSINDWQRVENTKMPPKMLFSNYFLEQLDIAIADLDWYEKGSPVHKMGRLLWYRTIQNGNNHFVHCQLDDRKFVWHLVFNHKENHTGLCHIVGLWRD